MSDALTVSFCERCGSRHEFRAPRGLSPLRRTRGFIGGLRNYLVSDDGLSDAMRDAMQIQESAVAAAQLEAFHDAVHLCLDCRQYTCNDCWNADAGRCRSCAPVVGVDDLGDRIAASLATDAAGAASAFAPGTTVPVFTHAEPITLPAESWPEADREVYGNAPSAGDGTPGDEAEPAPTSTELAVVPDVGDEPASEAPWELEAEPEPEPERRELEPTTAFVAQPELEPAFSGDDAAEDEPVPTGAFDQPQREPIVADRGVEPVVPASEATDFDEPEPVAAERDVELEAPVPALRVVAWDEDAAPVVVEPESVELAGAFEADEHDAQPLEPVAVADLLDEIEGDGLEAVAFVAPDPADAADEEALAPIGGSETELAVADAVEFGGAAEPEVTAEPELAAEPEAAEPEVTAEPELAPEAAEPEAAEPEAAEPEAAEPEAAEPEAAEREAPEPEPAAEPSVAAVPPVVPRRTGPMREKIIRPPSPAAPVEHPVVRVAAVAETEEQAARRAQLEELGLADAEAAEPDAEAQRVLPYRSRGAVAPAARQPAVTAEAMLWEASAREVGAAGVTVQSCTGCGLALSASARFCRRCGTRQAQSA